MFQNRISVTGIVAAAFVACSTAALCAPAKMNAIVQTGPGVEKMQLQSVDTPRPGPNQVLMKVYAAGVNPVDWKRIPATTTLTSGSVLPPIPGFDASGVVDGVGAGVTAFKTGDAVVARVTGAFAQYAVVNVEDLAPKPRAFTFIQAGAMPIAGVAGFATVVAADVKAGQRVAIIGAAGGAGSAAVDIVHGRGAKVIASGHSSQGAWLKEQHVEDFVAYDKEKVASRIKDVDAVLNMADGQAEAALAYVKRGGHLASIAGIASGDKCAAAGVTCTQIRGTAPGMTAGESLRAISKLADEGKYTPRVTKTFPLAQAAAAQRVAHVGDSVGKVVLIVDPKARDR
ncbi:MAG TPA: zinc-binding dehydrogenase [Steroidobacteraceae bacterium]|nr:zinc-binding dehydrogenase [Steroidobacteraceae bacterium]